MLLTGSGTIDSRELRATLVALGQTPTEEEVFNMMKLVCNQCNAVSKW